MWGCQTPGIIGPEQTSREHINISGVYAGISQTPSTYLYATVNV